MYKTYWFFENFGTFSYSAGPITKKTSFVPIDLENFGTFEQF